MNTLHPLFLSARRTEVLNTLRDLFSGRHVSPAILEAAIHAGSEELRRVDEIEGRQDAAIAAADKVLAFRRGQAAP